MHVKIRLFIQMITFSFTLPMTWVFGLQVHLGTIQIIFEYQGHRSKFKITGGKCYISDYGCMLLCDVYTFWIARGQQQTSTYTLKRQITVWLIDCRVFCANAVSATSSDTFLIIRTPARLSPCIVSILPPPLIMTIVCRFHYDSISLYLSRCFDIVHV